MNLGGASNVDLTEAARLLKQSAVGAAAGVQNQQVPPPMMLMQQAVAMQQFQFQQALLMQQVMATQQAAARAATVKSAQEMAAARAAEISKLLKGNEPEVEEEKKSPGRSISRTPSRSRSRSRSFSRSKSRSPLRYRRDRSASRSPIRYRRDSRPSPVSREYFGYRGRSRRGYYRGRGEYAWNPSYRRDWERERDHYSSRSRRSRSRSRSRVRRRSHSLSRSPRPRRDRSGTPVRYRHEERKSGRGSRRSRSVEGRPAPSRSSRSRSRSRTRTRSRSRSESLHPERGSQSPVRRSGDTRSGGVTSKGEKVSPVPSEGRRTLMSSPDTKGSKEKNYSDDIADDKEETLEHSRPKGRDQQSISPARSLSVSLSPPRRKNAGTLEGAPKPNDWKKAMLREVLVQKIDEVAALAEQPQSNRAPSVMGIEGGEGSPAALLGQEIDAKGAFKSKGGDFVAKGRHAKKESGRMELSSDESDGNKEVDDWRDDIKANELEKIKRMESKREMERREEERKALPVQVVVQEEVKGHGMTLLEHLGRGTGKLSIESPFTSEVQGDIIAAFKANKGVSSIDLVPVEPNCSDETRVNGSMGLSVKEEILDRVSTGNGEGDADVNAEAGDVTHEKSIGSADVSDREESDVVFEGPLPPQEEDLDLEVGKRSPNSSKGEESAEEIGAEEPPSVAEEETTGNFKGKDNSKRRGEEDVRGIRRGKDKSGLKEDGESHGNRKSKEKSRSRERSRSKRHGDEADNERRKDKHRKHKKRRRRDEETEKDEDDDDEKRDVDSSKDKEERRHHRSKKHRSGRDRKEDKREKKRRRHKHRGKSPSESPDKESLVVEAEGEDVGQVAGRVHKKQSGGHEIRRKEALKSPAHASESGSD